MSEVTVLIILSIVPEKCDLYLVTVDETEAEILKTADGKLINRDEPTPGLYALAYAMCTEFTDDGEIPRYHLQDMNEIGLDQSWYAKYKDCKLDSLPDLSGMNISTVINTGFAL